MFPEFPTLRHDLAKQLHTLFEQMVEAKAPLFAKIPIVAQHEGTLHSYDRIGADSKTEGQEQIAIPIPFNVDEVPELVGDKLLAKLDGLAAELAQKKMELFDRKFRETTEEVGNAFNANGAPLTQDMFLSVLERVDMEFGRDGKPTAEFFPSSIRLREVIDTWHMDRTFKERYEAIIGRKRDEWRDRESNRKLVD